MLGKNYTEEFKYPIKFYKVGRGKWRIEFKEGFELRKAVIVGIVFLILFIVLVWSILNKQWGIVQFFISNWVIMLVGIPAILIALLFGLKYDRKPVLAFFRDRVWFYRNKNKSWEHFEEVPAEQMNRPLNFEKMNKKRR
ncbi:conjugal transfer protein [Listeria monocytogenes]|uniref:TcpE family conjugal transfer membrane protein n=1 Tax=Listeria seeligeri TaxID=1640 RepID=UPI0010BB1153|nr:TcpE family conjugal transfer membrane protein [Listeria seeligeri]EAC4184101.1 conjugal transfer protein [Listeria monocytogenes]EEO3421831.1 conjugal transfer protein [Listeria monocytogenes]MBF2629991.1 conjugal transfer protein [Listeria seeligeri]